MEAQLTIGIVGCGIGGLTAALSLRRQGHDVTLYDQFDSPKPVGSGLVIQPVGLRCLAYLDLAQSAVDRGQPIYAMDGIESVSRETALHVEYGIPNGPEFGLGIHRADLFELLYDAATHAGVAMTGECEIVHTFASAQNRFITARDGKKFGPFDLVIDSSGAHSCLSPIKTVDLPYGALWGTVDWPDGSPLARDFLSQCYQGAHHMLGVLPVGPDPINSRPRAAVFWSEPTDTLDEWFAADLKAWKDRANALWPEFEPFSAQITSHDHLCAARYRHGTLRKPYASRLAFIGDAAHQTSPQLGQGANMAMLDAVVLADALIADDVDHALVQYAKRRRGHVSFYQRVSQMFTPFYQSSDPIRPLIRNKFFHPMSQTWAFKPILTKMVAGSLVDPGWGRK